MELHNDIPTDLGNPTALRCKVTVAGECTVVTRSIVRVLDLSDASKMARVVLE